MQVRRLASVEEFLIVRRLGEVDLCRQAAASCDGVHIKSHVAFLSSVAFASLSDAGRKAGRHQPQRSWTTRKTGSAGRMERADIERAAPSGIVASNRERGATGRKNGSTGAVMPSALPAAPEFCRCVSSYADGKDRSIGRAHDGNA